MRFKKPAKKPLRARRPPLVPIIILGVFALLAIFADVITPYSPLEGSLDEVLIPPLGQNGGSLHHLLGTDRLGRDMLARIIFGARVSLIVSLVAILVGGSFGIAVGLMAGYFGGWLDSILMRMVDIMLSLPLILIALIGATVFRPSLKIIILLIAFFIWARYARQVRGEVLSVKERDFIAQARIAGCSSTRIILVHIFPNVVNTLIVLATLQVGWVILLESSLSFLGAGVPPPTPAWGSMVADGRSMVSAAWWLSFFPGMAILLSILSLNLLGDWLRDSLDPKLRQI